MTASKMRLSLTPDSSTPYLNKHIAHSPMPTYNMDCVIRWYFQLKSLKHTTYSSYFIVFNKKKQSFT